MKLARSIFPKIPRQTQEQALRMVSLLFLRDEEVRRTVNNNDNNSATKSRVWFLAGLVFLLLASGASAHGNRCIPGAETTVTNGLNWVEIVPAVPEGFVRSVELITVHNRDTAPIRYGAMILTEDGFRIFQHSRGALGVLITDTFPDHGQYRLLPGWSMHIHTTWPKVNDAHVTAHWCDVRAH